MKTKIILTIVSAFFAFTLNAQSKIVTATIKVYGNCTQCKKRIETALDHKGIKKAEWSPKTKELQVVYNSNKITELEIHELVANVGHDTDKVKAKDDVYASLPFCCLYRDHEMNEQDHKMMNH
ncbi:MAG TPA: cation-transporting ATPase [Cytophagales bacterium]|jgi:periplasmic mercuric ion binding protein|nr:cation-transporting ATPase [Cytophagales bacterium]